MTETKEKSEIESVDHVRISTVMLFAAGTLVPVFMLALTGMMGLPLFPSRSAGAAFIPSIPVSNFGGRIIGYAPMIPNAASPLTPICPAHMIIKNFVPAGPSVLGLYVFPTAVFRYLYSYVFNGASLYKFPPALPIGTATLGKDVPFPWASCPFPYPVVSILPLNGIYYIGTALHP